MLANLFGLHLGCKVKLEKEERLLVGINQNIAIVITKDNSGHVSCLSFDEFKLILKPLSSISENDKRELSDILNIDLYNDYNDYVDFENKFFQRYRQLCKPFNIDAILWLVSKGYDVGIIPDEYKIVREK